MPDVSGLGKVLVVMGAFLVVLGGLIMLADKWTSGEGWGWLGRLPGDLFIKREHFTVYIPLATSLLVSIILSVILIVVTTLFKR